jgi:hypothetical protein
MNSKATQIPRRCLYQFCSECHKDPADPCPRGCCEANRARMMRYGPAEPVDARRRHLCPKCGGDRELIFKDAPTIATICPVCNGTGKGRGP